MNIPNYTLLALFVLLSNTSLFSQPNEYKFSVGFDVLQYHHYYNLPDDTGYDYYSSYHYKRSRTVIPSFGFEYGSIHGFYMSYAFGTSSENFRKKPNEYNSEITITSLSFNFLDLGYVRNISIQNAHSIRLAIGPSITHVNREDDTQKMATYTTGGAISVGYDYRVYSWASIYSRFNSKVTSIVGADKYIDEEEQKLNIYYGLSFGVNIIL